MEETIKNVISDLQYKVDVLKQEKQYPTGYVPQLRNMRTAILLPVLQE